MSRLNAVRHGRQALLLVLLGSAAPALAQDPEPPAPAGRDAAAGDAPPPVAPRARRRARAPTRPPISPASRRATRSTC